MGFGIDVKEYKIVYDGFTELRDITENAINGNVCYKVEKMIMCDCFFIMRIYNTKQWLQEAIDSILNQTNPSLKLFLFDNGSTDGCKEICEHYKNKDNRVLLYRTEENRHFSDLESHAIIRDAFLESNAKYFSFLDSDDRYSENYLETVLKIAEEENADVVVAGWERIDCDGKSLPGKVEPMRTVIEKRKIFFEEMSNLFAPFHTLWNKLYCAEMYTAYWNAISRLPANASNGGDFYMMRYILSEADKIICIPDILHQWRMRHREKTYTPILDNSWLYLAPIRNYVENRKFLSHFSFYEKDKKKLQKWIGKLCYADTKSVCEGIMNDSRDDCTEKKLQILYEIISHEDFEALLRADWRIPILVRNCEQCVAHEKNVGTHDIDKIENSEPWKKLVRKSPLNKRIMFEIRKNVVALYLKMRNT